MIFYYKEHLNSFTAIKARLSLIRAFAKSSDIEVLFHVRGRWDILGSVDDYVFYEFRPAKLSGKYFIFYDEIERKEYKLIKTKHSEIQIEATT